MLATVEQSRHDFDGALKHLAEALARDPNDAQAWLTHASILSVLGRYDEARASCTPLGELASSFLVAVCHAPIDAVSHRASEAKAALVGALGMARSRSELAWARSLLGEIAFWQGDLNEAETQLNQVLALDPTDRYARALLADAYLERGRAEQVLALVRGRDGDDALVLRAALAALQLRRADASELVARLRSRFADSRLRGDFVHQREEARLLLALKGCETDALRSARETFATQHEPWDARLLLSAAAREHAPQAAAPALAWLRETGFESPTLSALAARVESLP
jgi:Flp pilus assembly protein TadD